MKGKRMTTAAIASAVTCQQCGAGMVQAKRVEGNDRIWLGIILFVLGIFISVVPPFTCWGAIIGIPLILYSLGMGGKRMKVWKCPDCGYYFERA